MYALELDDIHKAFATGFWGRRLSVLRGLSLRIRQGEVYGLLGPNGAGKTTTMRIALGLLRPNGGAVRLFGEPVSKKATRARVGYLSDDIGLYPTFTAREMMRFSGELFRMERRQLESRIDELLQEVGLTAVAKARVRGFSKGMRQRLGIALAMLNNPDLLILDEPYIGLDPIGRREIRELMLRLKRSGKTILMSSHIVPDIEAISDRVGFLSHGCIRREVALRDLFTNDESPVEITVTKVDPRTFDSVDKRVEIVYHNQEALVLRCEHAGLVKSVISKVYAFGGTIVEIRRLRFGLEDYLYESVAEPATEESSDPPKPTSKRKQEKGDYAHVS